MKTLQATEFLVICSLLSFFLYGSVANVLPALTRNFCHSYETECRYGCCPLANATCCPGGMQCCQHGAICFPDRGLCMSPRTHNGTVASNRPSPVTLPASPDKNSFVCPPRTTPCGENKCCFFRDATCCEDGLHCCPYNYRCDLDQGRCYMNINNDLTSNLDDDYNGTAVSKLFRSIEKSPYETCPGSDLHCPSYSHCCSDDQGQWSCCLKSFEAECDQGDSCEDNPVTDTIW